MWTFIIYEIRHWLRQPMTWIFLLINTLLVFGAVSSENIQIGGGVGSVLKNSPYVVEGYYGAMSLVCLLMTTAFMNATANRDFQFNMYQFVFSSPIKKRDYYFGKFFGAYFIAVLPLLGVSLGALIGPLMPWVQEHRYGEVILSGHVNGFLAFGVANTFIAGVWLFVLAIIFRSPAVSFIGSMLILVLYAVSQGFTQDIEKEWLANILDPFGFRPHNIVGKYMTVDEKNLSGVPITGPWLFNRLAWIAVSLIILIASYFSFSFSARSRKSRKEKKEVSPAPSISTTLPAAEPALAGTFNLKTFFYLFRFELRSIIRNPTFIIIVIIGLINLVASLTSFTGRYGTQQYPVTYDVVDAIRGSFYLFLIGIVTFYSGVLVWKERDARLSEIQDATPVRTSLLFSSKLFALIAAVALVLLSTILIGVIAQTCYAYTRFELNVYLKSLLVIDLLGFAYLVVIALLFHYLINNRYVAYFAFVVFIILNQFIWTAFEIDSNMVEFGGSPSVIYSDMNGFGPFVSGLTWFNIYWTIFSVIVCMVIFAFYIRGREEQFRHRLLKARQAFGRTRLSLAAFIIIFLLCGGFVYYNTKVLNTYQSSDETERDQVEYEKLYKKYESLSQPYYTNLNYQIDIHPDERNLFVNVQAWARNKSAEAIKEIHFTMPSLSDSVLIAIAGARQTLRDNRCDYRIYALENPLQPGDSLEVQVKLWKIHRGFENEVSFTQLTHNGTFFNHLDIMPRIGYQENMELGDKNDRIKHKLPPRRRMPALDPSNMEARSSTYLGRDAGWVMVTTTISTSADQVAVAPGSLLKSWEKDGRRYFHYQLDHPSLNFYSFISARFEVARKKHKGIDLEVYYMKEHDYNVPNMLRSMEKSLDYYLANFGPYYHRQCRIIEFPRYASFAQAFPGTMPYSEGIGFIVDLRDVKDEDIDQVYYVVAHEMAHQYWAHQVCGARMQGSELMSEGFAQYSALMVMEKEYGKQKMKKFLQYEMDSYLRGRSSERLAERPLMKTENQGYIHYQKASVVMYYLKEMIGEDKVNATLRTLIDSFAYKGPPFPVSTFIVEEFRKATPDSLKYLIPDLFENIIEFSNRVTEASYKKTGDEYEVTIVTTSEKFLCDSLGSSKPITMADYIDIGVFAKPKGDEKPGPVLAISRQKINGTENRFILRVKEKPYQAGIDPYNYLVDRVSADNLKVIRED